MNATTALLAGIGIGFLAARLLSNPSSCCTRVAKGVRDRVGEELGAGAQAAGDLFGLWSVTPGLLDLFGVT